jgi:predicted nucleotidyltransferase
MSMDYSKVFHLVAEASRKTAVPCILIGGFAVNFYKVTRGTRDVDFLMTKDDFKKIEKILSEAGYAENFATNVAVRMSSAKDTVDIDFMIVDEATRDKILREGQKTTIAGMELVVPSLNHLIALKLHAIKHGAKNRLLKDLPDIIELIKMNNIDFEGEEFKGICLKFGTKEIYNDILGVFKK